MSKMMALTTAALLASNMLLVAPVLPQSVSAYEKVCRNTFALFYEGPASHIKTPNHKYSFESNKPYNDPSVQATTKPLREVGKLISTKQRNSACSCVQNAFENAGKSKSYIAQETVEMTAFGERLTFNFPEEYRRSVNQTQTRRHADALGTLLRGFSGQRNTPTSRVETFRKTALRCVNTADPYWARPFRTNPFFRNVHNALHTGEIPKN